MANNSSFMRSSVGRIIKNIENMVEALKYNNNVVWSSEYIQK